MTCHSDKELLTVEQFAKRFQVSRATVFVWLHKSIFTKGKHYLKIGRVLRFFWPMEGIEIIVQEPVQAKAGVRMIRQKKSSPLNWNY